jgi:hypothetical protein
MRNKNNIILKTGSRALISGSGLHRRGLLVDIRDHLNNVHHETIVNNPTYGRIISSKKIDDSVKIGNINESSKHPDTHSDLVDTFHITLYDIINQDDYHIIFMIFRILSKHHIIIK